MNVEGPFKKFLEFNSKLEDSNLTIGNDATLKSLLDKIAKSEFYHSSTFTDIELALLLKLSKWPLENLIPFLDTLRMFFIHPRSGVFLSKAGDEILSKLFDILKIGTDTQKILVLRIFNNMFLQEESRNFLIKKRQEILDNASVYLDSENTNIKSALIALLFKYVKVLTLAMQLNTLDYQMTRKQVYKCFL
jgi:hypothetical protein